MTNLPYDEFTISPLRLKLPTKLRSELVTWTGKWRRNSATALV